MNFDINETSNIKAELGSIIVTNQDIYLITSVNGNYALTSLNDNIQYGIRGSYEGLIDAIETLYHEDILRIISNENLTLREEK